MSRRRLHLLLQSVGAIAWLVLQGASIASAASIGAFQAAAEEMAGLDGEAFVHRDEVVLAWADAPA